MAAFLKAILADIAFLLDNMKMTAASMEDKRLKNLERLLLRVHVIVEEAEGRHITNKAMVYQLDLLRKEMYRGHFIVDNLKTQRTEARGQDVSNSSFVLSIFNPAKRLFLSNVDRDSREIDIQQVINKLNNIMEGVNNETIMFLKNYPPLYRQPSSVHLFIDNCMFGRQMEMERIMEFFMQKDDGTRSVGVLPIVGPIFVGKSTLVAHVCKDARVCDYFSQIMIINVDDINNENVSTLTDRGVMMHQNDASGENQRLLAIIELSGDVDVAAWNSLFSSPCYIGRASKIIITSRSNNIVKFGTTQALMLNFLPPEAYWYFFKNTLFGSTDSSNHPGLESIAMEIARGLNGSFLGANVTFGFLRNKLVAQYWWRYLATFRKVIQRNRLLFGERPCGLMSECKPTTFLIGGEFVVWGSYRACSIEENVPQMTMEDVMYGHARDQGEFDVLVWKSRIPPYNSYIVSCMIEKLE